MAVLTLTMPGLTMAVRPTYHGYTYYGYTYYGGDRGAAPPRPRGVLVTTYCLLLTAYYLLLTAYCVLRTACYSIRTTIYIGAPPRLRGPLARQDEALPLARGARHERPAHDTLALPPRATRGHDLLGDGLR